MTQDNEESLIRKELDEIYTPLEVAKEEIWRRWNDKELKGKVEDFLKGDIPEIFKESPRAALSRHVLSPNFELLNFLESVKEIGLKPAGLEYLEDKFVTKNEDKYYLGKLFFYEGIGKKGGRKTSSLKVLDFDLCDGKKFSDIRTIWKEDLISLHHKLVHPFVSDENIVDMSNNYRRNGMQASGYYRYILSLFICHGVLFENFLLSDVYKDLTEKILLPSYKEVFDIFGVKPLIVRLVPEESEEDIYWRYYPELMKDKVSGIMNEGSH